MFDSSSSAESLVGENGVGNSGGIQIQAANVEITDGAQLTTTTLGRGNSGTIRINATGRVVFDGTVQVRDEIGRVPLGGGVFIPEFSFSELASSAESLVGENGIGNSGGIQIQAANVEITDGAQLTTTTLGRGDSSLIDISATDTVVFDSSSSAVSLVGENGVGNSGGIEIQAANVEITDRAQLTTTTLGRGNSGLIDITATDTVRFDSSSSAVSLVGENGVGNSGGIEIQAANVEITDRAQLTTTNLGRGDSGLIDITATDTILLDGRTRDGFGGFPALVRTGALGDAVEIPENNTNNPSDFAATVALSSGEQIQIGTTNLTRTNEGQIQITSSNFGGGNTLFDFRVTITNNSIDGNDTISVSVEHRPPGGGGISPITTTITITLTPINSDTDSVPQENRDGLGNGADTVSVPQEDKDRLGNSIITSWVGQDACTSDAGASGLVLKGNGGVPPAPNLPLNAELLLGDSKPITPNISQVNNQQTTQNNTFQVQPVKTSVGDIYPARGIMKTEDGRVILTAYPTGNNTVRVARDAANCHQIQ
ncbi:MAG: hypothetical protein QNJ32_14620 [Xenococcaceae cyanobacterium MO_167.B27]|nr:hypothetical protein [Xenococcaceae cyanobacterium MO_167.B27]